MAAPKRTSQTPNQSVGIKLSKVLGRTKGETIEALEQVEVACRQALLALRQEGASVLLEAGPQASIRNAHSALTRVLAKQQFAKGVMSALSGQHEI